MEEVLKVCAGSVIFTHVTHTLTSCLHEIACAHIYQKTTTLTLGVILLATWRVNTPSTQDTHTHTHTHGVHMKWKRLHSFSDKLCVVTSFLLLAKSTDTETKTAQCVFGDRAVQTHRSPKPTMSQISKQIRLEAATIRRAQLCVVNAHSTPSVRKELRQR